MVETGAASAVMRRWGERLLIDVVVCEWLVVRICGMHGDLPFGVATVCNMDNSLISWLEIEGRLC